MQIKTSGWKVRFFAWFGFVTWLAAVGVGALWMSKKVNTPGANEQPPARWPLQATITASGSKPVLLMFAHPRCPCTMSSLRELEALVARTQGRIATHVFFLSPLDKPATWTETALWQQAAFIPGVNVHLDPDGAQARLFHSSTSGATVVYSSDGRLLFYGGITKSRGHEGDNAGLDAVIAVVNHPANAMAKSRVFGCSLFPNRCPEKIRL